MSIDSKNSTIAQVFSLPNMIREEFKQLDAQIRQLMNHEEFLSVKRVIITGCGDSHMAGLATELAFEQIAGIPCEPMRAARSARKARARWYSASVWARVALLPTKIFTTDAPSRAAYATPRHTSSQAC